MRSGNSTTKPRHTNTRHAISVGSNPPKAGFQRGSGRDVSTGWGTSAQIELRSLVEAAVNVQWLIQSTHHPIPTLSESSPSICLICREEFPALVDLAKHARCHLTALRCEGICDACDRQSLPFFVDENIGKRQKGGHTSSEADPPAIGYRGHKIPSYQRGPPRGSWVCCSCRQTHLLDTCPTRCSLDGHFKCDRCFKYK